MSYSKTTTRKYTYTSSGGAQSDVKVEFHSDQMALARMEVSETIDGLVLLIVLSVCEGWRVLTTET